MSQAGESSRATPRVLVQFSQPDRCYAPGDAFRVSYEIEGLGDEAPWAIEHSVLWYTEGKGEEDLGVHFFERLADRENIPPAAGCVATRLPTSPLTYEGAIVKIRWCVRIRIFFAGGRDFVSEHVFELGMVPPACMPRGSGP